MIATVLVVLAVVFLLCAAFGLQSAVGVHTQPLGLALVVAAWLAQLLKFP